MHTAFLTFLTNYAINMKAANFPVLTANRREKKTTAIEIIMLGDSHSWGQGGPGYDVIPPVYSTHMAIPYNKGYFARLQKHLIAKYDLYQSAYIPGFWNNGLKIKGIGGSCKQTTQKIMEPMAAQGFYAPHSDETQTMKHLGYLAQYKKFNEALLVMAPKSLDGQKSIFYVDMEAHATCVYIGLITGRSGARLEVFFREQNSENGDFIEFGKRNIAGMLYTQAEGFPKVTRVMNGVHYPVAEAEAAVEHSTHIVIETYRAAADEEAVYCIDYGQKQKGRLVCAYEGAHSDALPFSDEEPDWQCPVLRIRGLIFDGNDVRNFSMGGHTTGQWLGDGSASFNDPDYPHLAEVLRFIPFTPTLVIIQAPVVNEYIRQTPINRFTANLNTLIEVLNNHHNKAGGRKMDVLLFTTPGDKTIQYENQASSPISYEAYFAAVKEVCEQKGYGFIDFERYFHDCAASGLLDYEFLFDDPIHPSPYVNETIAKTLTEVVDLIM